MSQYVLENITWDLDGLLDLKGLEKKNTMDLSNESDLIVPSFTEYVYKQYYINFFNAYKNTLKFTREAALGFTFYEFTTNKEIYKETGIYAVEIDELYENAVFYGNSDMFIYFFSIFKSLKEIDSHITFVFTELSSKYDFKEDSNFMYCFLCLENIKFDVINKYDIIKHFGLDKIYD